MLKTLKVYSLVIITSALITLYLIEAFLLASQHKKSLEYKIAIYKKKTGLDYDLRSIVEVFEDEKKNGEDVAIRYLPQILLKDNINLQNKNLFPLSGISKTKTIFCNEEGYFAFYNSDRYGFNNPDIVWEDSDIDAIIIGGSFVHGSCVNRPNDISSVIRNTTNTNVINLGYRGNGPLTEYATLKEYFIKGTNNIIWIHYENEIEILKDELKNPILKNYLINDNFSQKLIYKQEEIDRANKDLMNYLYNTEVRTLKQNKKDMSKKNKILKFVRFDNLKRLIKNYFNKSNLQDKNLPYNYFSKILKKVKIFADKNGSNFYFVYLPELKNLDKKNFEEIKVITNDLGINLIDLKNELFDNLENPQKLFSFETGGHLNVNGYNKLANKIIELTKLK